jgi:hypothetical protein
MQISISFSSPPNNVCSSSIARNLHEAAAPSLRTQLYFRTTADPHLFFLPGRAGPHLFFGADVVVELERTGVVEQRRGSSMGLGRGRARGDGASRVSLGWGEGRAPLAHLASDADLHRVPPDAFMANKLLLHLERGGRRQRAGGRARGERARRCRAPPLHRRHPSPSPPRRRRAGGRAPWGT